MTVMRSDLKNCTIVMVADEQMKAMKQTGSGETGFCRRQGRTRKAVFLSEMESVVPWSRLETLIEPFYPKKRPPADAVGHDAADSLHAAMVWLLRSGDGRSAARRTVAAAVCRTGCLRRCDAGRKHRSSLPHLLEKTIWPWRSLPRSTRGAVGERPVDEAWERSSMPALITAEFDQERRQEARSRDDANQEGPSVALRHEGAYRC